MTDTKTLTPQQELNAKVNEFQALISECETIAENNGLQFSINPVYGAGATFRARDSWDESSWDDSSDESDTSHEWFASSESC
jgi:hypothetical protein